MGLASATMPPYTVSTISPGLTATAIARRKAGSSSGWTVVLGMSMAVFAGSM